MKQTTKSHLFLSKLKIYQSFNLSKWKVITQFLISTATAIIFKYNSVCDIYLFYICVYISVCIYIYIYIYFVLHGIYIYVYQAKNKCTKHVPRLEKQQQSDVQLAPIYIYILDPGRFTPFGVHPRKVHPFIIFFSHPYG